MENKRLTLDFLFLKSDSPPGKQIGREWLPLLGPLAKKMKGQLTEYSGNYSTENLIDLMPEDETTFGVSSSSKDMGTPNWSFVSWAPVAGCSCADINISVDHPEVREAFVAWGLARPSLVSVRLENVDYWMEQNEKNPEHYEILFGRKSTSPLIPNGLPKPHDGMMIDTSAHAGRAIARKGYVEAVSAQMWLGPHFWAATGARKEEVLAAAEWLLEVKQLPGDVLYLKALDVPFSSAEGHEAELQNKLRALLFPRSVTNPT